MSWSDMRRALKSAPARSLLWLRQVSNLGPFDRWAEHSTTTPRRPPKTDFWKIDWGIQEFSNWWIMFRVIFPFLWIRHWSHWRYSNNYKWSFFKFRKKKAFWEIRKSNLLINFELENSWWYTSNDFTNLFFFPVIALQIHSKGQSSTSKQPSSFWWVLNVNISR